jgi:hypothetical protein
MSSNKIEINTSGIVLIKDMQELYLQGFTKENDTKSIISNLTKLFKNTVTVKIIEESNSQYTFKILLYSLDKTKYDTIVIQNSNKYLAELSVIKSLIELLMES